MIDKAKADEYENGFDFGCGIERVYGSRSLELAMTERDRLQSLENARTDNLELEPKKLWIVEEHVECS